MFKRVLIFLIVSAFSANFTFAQSDSEKEISDLNAGFMLTDEGYFNNFPSYQFDSVNRPLTLIPLSSTAAQRAKDDQLVAFLLNFFIGMGIGSFYQGDTVGGVICLGGELLGAGLITIGFIGMYRTILDTSADEDISFDDKSFAVIIAGAAVYTAARIFSYIRPSMYANSFPVAVLPGVDKEGQPALVAMVNFKF